MTRSPKLRAMASIGAILSELDRANGVRDPPAERNRPETLVLARYFHVPGTVNGISWELLEHISPGLFVTMYHDMR